jgi:ABC-type lipoprotein export system ATPase subunit
MATAISCKQLGVTFRGRGRNGPVLALQSLDLEVAAGRIVGVLGPNGSGKTTLLRVLAGLEQPTAGAVTILGERPAAKSLRRRVAFQPEGALPLGVLSAAEFLAYIGAELGLPNAESDARAQRWLERLDLLGPGKRWIRTFSTGMQKRLALAAALLGDPEVPAARRTDRGSRSVRQRDRDGDPARTRSGRRHGADGQPPAVRGRRDLRRGPGPAGGAVAARGALSDLLGTDAHALVVRGLDEAGLGHLAAAARARGGEVLRTERPRDHLFALFRRLAQRRGEGRRS